jgi:D-amino peptidase
MEGATGVTTWDDVTPGEKFYNQSRKLITQDVNAAIEGALEEGATEILVNEAHNGMRNLLLDKISPKARVIRGFAGKKKGMMEGIDQSFDKVFLVGYHARAGTLGAILNHTFLLQVHNFWINGVVVGEGGLSAAIAGDYGVPIALVTGDDKTVLEMKSLVPSIESAEVKKGISRYTANCLPPEATYGLIKEAAKKALSSDVRPYVAKSPVTAEIEFSSIEMANIASWVPTVELVEPRKVSCIGDNFVEAWQTIFTPMLLGWGAEKYV